MLEASRLSTRTAPVCCSLPVIEGEVIFLAGLAQAFSGLKSSPDLLRHGGRYLRAGAAPRGLRHPHALLQPLCCLADAVLSGVPEVKACIEFDDFHFVSLAKTRVRELGCLALLERKSWVREGGFPGVSPRCLHGRDMTCQRQPPRFR